MPQGEEGPAQAIRQQQAATRKPHDVFEVAALQEELQAQDKQCK
eukprot:CAMPEP_0179194580 /NCGR_PEP_ID=MMETSP0796-20121207/96710_1 /TAXON_ID=73915 /ORGANISM="Pyrodinium bahamense, Strain pbaha01" /LENGTH=43 /DNA_ID= /DNA_START= /DNA_END= /DNA_ORIENTATION=